MVTIKNVRKVLVSDPVNNIKGVNEIDCNQPVHRNISEKTYNTDSVDCLNTYCNFNSLRM